MKKKKLLVLAACGLLAIGGAVGAYSLYSGTTDKVENNFVIKAGESGATGEDKVGKVVEDEWEKGGKDEAKDMVPNKVVKKDPKFKSSAEYDAWVFMKVEIPAVSASTSADKTLSVMDAIDIVKYNTTENGGKWKLLKTDKSTTAGTNSAYWYGYTEQVSKGDSTGTLFDEIQVPNFTKLETKVEDSIDVKAYIMQGFDDVSNIDGAWAKSGLATDESQFTSSSTSGNSITDNDDPVVVDTATDTKSDNTEEELVNDLDVVSFVDGAEIVAANTNPVPELVTYVDEDGTVEIQEEETPL